MAPAEGATTTLRHFLTHLLVVGLEEEVLAELVEADEHRLERAQVVLHAALHRVGGRSRLSTRHIGALGALSAAAPIPTPAKQLQQNTTVDVVGISKGAKRNRV